MMSEEKGDLIAGGLGAFLGLLPVVGNSILLILSITKKKPTYIAVSAACVFISIITGFVLEYGSITTFGPISAESGKFYIGFCFIISYFLNAIFCMNFFYKYSGDPFYLLYPKGKENVVDPAKKTLNGLVGLLLGIFPIACSVACILLSIKTKNKPAGIISLIYLVSVILLLRVFGISSFLTIPTLIFFSVFSCILFYNYLGYREGICT